MKKIFTLAMIVGFFLMGSVAFAWQDPCSATENVYVCNGYTLDSWVEEGPQFSPAPRCAGSVTLWAPDGTEYQLAYIGTNDIITIAGVACQVSNDGNLVCKVITQPEESTTLTFGQQE